tara:strand:+ start:621 stop:872 length:252 start_codon:yes stop_codon:yes gene_type:complete
MHLLFRQVLLCIDGRYRALGNAYGAINALVWVDGEEVGALPKAVDGTDVNAIGVLALDTGFGNDVCHKQRRDRVSCKANILSA